MWELWRIEWESIVFLREYSTTMACQLGGDDKMLALALGEGREQCVV